MCGSCIFASVCNSWRGVSVRIEYFSSAIGDMFWTLFPMLLVVLVAFLCRESGKLAFQPDMMLLSSILFGEGVSKGRKLKFKVDADEMASMSVGMLGFSISIVVATILLIAGYGGSELSSYIKVDILQHHLFSELQVVLWVGSFIYGLSVRYRLISQERKLTDKLLLNKHGNPPALPGSFNGLT